MAAAMQPYKVGGRSLVGTAQPPTLPDLQQYMVACCTLHHASPRRWFIVVLRPCLPDCTVESPSSQSIIGFHMFAHRPPSHDPGWRAAHSVGEGQSGAGMCIPRRLRREKSLEYVTWGSAGSPPTTPNLTTIAICSSPRGRVCMQEHLRLNGWTCHLHRC